MSANNQGIFHLNLNGQVACKNRTAHMYTPINEFRVSHKRCKRCEKVLAKLDASAAKKAARLSTTGNQQYTRVTYGSDAGHGE